jgi:hypothetical protein
MKLVEQVRWARTHGSNELRAKSIWVFLTPVYILGLLAAALITRHVVFMCFVGLSSVVTSGFFKQLARENPDYPLPKGSLNFTVQRTLSRWLSIIVMVGIVVTGTLLLGPISARARELGTDPWWCIPFVIICGIALLVGLVFAALADRRTPLIVLFASANGFIASFGDWAKSHKLVFQQLSIFATLALIALLTMRFSARTKSAKGA